MLPLATVATSLVPSEDEANADQNATGAPLVCQEAPELVDRLSEVLKPAGALRRDGGTKRASGANL